MFELPDGVTTFNDTARHKNEILDLIRQTKEKHASTPA
jgi:hypothetical protein